MLCPENNAVEVTTNELIKIYFREPPAYDSDGYITIYNQDGTVFEEISLSSAQMIDQKSTRIMFDPKNDDRKLLNGWWEKIDSQEELSYVVKWLGFGTRHLYGNNLYRMMGPDENIYGYVFTPFTHVSFKKVDEKSMYVYYLDDPTWNWVY